MVSVEYHWGGGLDYVSGGVVVFSEGRIAGR